MDNCVGDFGAQKCKEKGEYFVGGYYDDVKCCLKHWMILSGDPVEEIRKETIEEVAKALEAKCYCRKIPIVCEWCNAAETVRNFNA